MYNNFSNFSWDFDKIIDYSADLTWKQKEEYSDYLRRKIESDSYWNDENNVPLFPQFELQTNTVLWFSDFLQLPVQLKYLRHIQQCTERRMDDLDLEIEKRKDQAMDERFSELKSQYLVEFDLNESDLTGEALEQFNEMIKGDIEEEFKEWRYEQESSVLFNKGALLRQIDEIEKTIARGDYPAFDYDYNRVAEFAERLPLEEAVKYLNILAETYVPPDYSMMSIEEQGQEIRDIIDITYLRDSKLGELHFKGANGKQTITTNPKINSKVEWQFHRNDLILLLTELIGQKAMSIDYAAFMADFVEYHGKPYGDRKTEVGRIKQAYQDLFKTKRYPTTRFKAFIKYMNTKYGS